MKWVIAGVFLFLLLLIIANVHAEGRKVDFTAAITNQDDQPLKECVKAKEPPNQGECETFQEITLGMLTLRALTVQYPNDPAVSGEDQIRRALLAQEIYKNASVTLDGKDMTLICDAIAKFVAKTGQSMLITLRAWQMVDPARVKK